MRDGDVGLGRLQGTRDAASQYFHWCGIQVTTLHAVGCGRPVASRHRQAVIGRDVHIMSHCTR